MSGIKTENTSCGMDMTSGSLWKKIFLFSIPLMMSQVLEVLFNMSDVAVVGKFASYEHLGGWFDYNSGDAFYRISYRNGLWCQCNSGKAAWCKTAQRFERYNSNSIYSVPDCWNYCKHYMYFMCTFIAESIKY